MARDQYNLGELIPLRFEVRDDEGFLVDPTVWTLKIVTPSGEADVSTDVDHTDTGVFDLDYVPVEIGTFVAVFTASGEYAGVSTNVFLVTATSAELMTISLAQLKAYLNDPAESDQTLLDALAAERSAQSDAVRIDPYTPALREALFRRVARNLAARSVPIAQFSTFEGGATVVRVPSQDAEIMRLERPRRRLPVG